MEFRTYCADVSGASGYLWGSCKFSVLGRLRFLHNSSSPCHFPFSAITDDVYDSFVDTNGAGLYAVSALKEIGRMFGEPGDGFHDAYVEANYAYRAALKVSSRSLQFAPPLCPHFPLSLTHT